MMCRRSIAISHFCCALLYAQQFSGVVTEEHSDKAVRGARVQLKVAAASRLIADLESGGDGTFRAASDLQAGEYLVSITKPNYADTKLRITLPLAGPLAVRLVRYMN
jgi:hypothetical protein